MIKKTKLFFLSFLLISSCANLGQVSQNATGDREIAASNNFEQDYKKFFLDVSLHQKIVNLRQIASSLSDEMNRNNNGKKNLVLVYLNDLNQVLFSFGKLGSSSVRSWVPSVGEQNYEKKLELLVKINESYDVMSKTGIFLSANKFYRIESQLAVYNLELLDRVNSELDLSLKKTGYSKMNDLKEKMEQLEKAKYITSLTNQIRNNLRKIYSDVNSTGYKKIDSHLKNIADAKTLAQMKMIANTRNHIVVARLMSALRNYNLNSNDINGFADEEATLLATKVNFELINQLISSEK